MSSRRRGTANTQANRFASIQSEIEAGLVFAAGSTEYRQSNPLRAEMCWAEAEDCCTTAIEMIDQSAFTHHHLQELRAMLAELQRRLEVSRPAKLVASSAA